MENLEIPHELQSKLRPRRIAQDGRTDAEIIEDLSGHVPVASEKNIWGFWHSGLRTMPRHWERNVVQWVRLNQVDGWTVRILDNNPDSANYALRFVPAELLPQAFKNHSMGGRFVGQHSADFVRTACIYQHGGVYLDVGIILIRPVDQICWNQLIDSANAYEVSTVLSHGTLPVNFFLAARKGNPFIKRLTDLFLHLWKGRTNCNGVSQSPLLASTLTDRTTGKFIEFPPGIADLAPGVRMQDVVDYSMQMWCWSQLACTRDPDEGFDGVDYWTRKTLLFPRVAEAHRGEQILNWDGRRFHELLCLSRDEQTRLQRPHDWKAAHDLTWSILADSAIVKIFKAGTFFTSVTLGLVMEYPENAGMDDIPGTWWELLRYGGLHFEQTREDMEYIPGPMPDRIIENFVFES